MINRLLIILFIISSYSIQSSAQFKATLTADGNDLIVYLTPSAGVNITTGFSQVEFFIRTTDMTTSFTMGAPVINSTDFPGNIPVALSSDANNGTHRVFQFGYAGTPSGSSATYTNGTQYEFARMTLTGGSPNSAVFELASDLALYSSYLNILNESGGDLTFSTCIAFGTCPGESVFTNGAPGLTSTSTTPMPVPLPVELSSFTGWNESKMNVLEWETLSEENSSYFEIQKSANAEDFERIGNVNAAGNSANPITYDFDDMNPFFGNNYYRLKIVDLDGTYEYSEVILIKAEGKATVKGFPNPFTNNISFELVAPISGIVQISLYDITGKQVLYLEREVASGLSNQDLKLDNLTEGTYIAKVLLPGSSEYLTTKIIKNNK